MVSVVEATYPSKLRTVLRHDRRAVGRLQCNPEDLVICGHKELPVEYDTRALGVHTHIRTFFFISTLLSTWGENTGVFGVSAVPN